MPKKYVAYLDGQLAGKRSTVDRTYSHAIVRVDADGSAHAVAWAGRLDLAQKQVRERSGWHPGVVYRIATAVLVDRFPKGA